MHDLATDVGWRLLLGVGLSLAGLCAVGIVVELWLVLTDCGIKRRARL